MFCLKQVSTQKTPRNFTIRKCLGGNRLDSLGGRAPGGGGDGAVYQFAVDDQGEWSDVHRMLPDSANTGAWPFGFGSSIAIEDDVAVVGMPRLDFCEGRAIRSYAI